MYEHTEYKGKKILVLKRDSEDPYPFSFGKLKAKLIVENIDIIRKFANEGEGGEDSTTKK